ncbi:F-box domain-containing protein [Favolaschia claudopus]|uniref:F-box domain-containing protein n=1 Tax=Favolaschia claudopus TaxID=2862362 RepID=A0AAW0DXQ5_9AGAR
MLDNLAADRNHVIDIDTEIRDLELRIANLRLERNTAQQRLDAYIYPVLTLPSEVISEIFIRTLPVYPLRPPKTGPSSPTLLSQICSPWREIALSTPQLWRAFSLSFDRHPNSTNSRHQTEFAETWLARSGSCPLSIKIHKKGTDHGKHPYAVIAAHRERWEHLWITSSIIDVPAFRCSTPLLRSLHLDGSLPFRPKQDPLTVAFNRAPLLRTASVPRCAVSSLTIPWAQLTSLTLDGGLFPNFIKTLNHTPNLIHCELKIFDPACNGPQFTMKLERLESLVLRHEHDDVFGGKLKKCYMPEYAVKIMREQIFTPALRSLTVPTTFLGQNTDAVTLTLASFVSNSGCTLEELTIIPPHPFAIRSTSVFSRVFATAVPKLSLQQAPAF